MNAAPGRYREKRLAEQRAEMLRIRALNAPIAPGPDGDDHGMDLGPAALARPTTLERVNGRLRGAAQRKAVPVYARTVESIDLFQRLNNVGQLSDRQCQAGQRLLALRHAAGLQPRVTAQCSVVQEQVAEVLDDAEVLESICPDGYDPRTFYRHLLRQVAAHTAQLIDAACDWNPEHPVGRPPTSFLATFQEGLNRIADELGLKRQGVGV